MKSGISTACFYPELTETALFELADHGIGATEVFFNAPSELSEHFLSQLGKLAREGGVEVLSVHPYSSGFEPFLLFSDYRRRSVDGFEYYKQFFNAANLLGAKLVIMHGARRNHPYGHEHYFDLFGELAELGRREGVVVAQENVPRCIGHDPAFFIEMAKYLPDSSFVLDIKQAIREGCDPLVMARAMGTRLCHLHVSDHLPDNDCLPVGQGELDLPTLLRELREKNGFDGGVLLEVYGDSYQQRDELYAAFHEIQNAIDLITI